MEERSIIDRPFVSAYNESRIIKVPNAVVDCKCAKILVVDDNEYNIYALKILLKNQGFDCEYTNNGKDAIEVV